VEEPFMLALLRRKRFYLASAFLLVLGSLYRVVSDHHDPPPYVNERKVAKVPVEILDQLVGSYIGPRSGAMDIQRDGDTLLLLIEKSNWVLYPESGSLFFLEDRDFTFQFVKNARHQVTKMIIRERGKIVETARASR
jgi:hypothetical protein